MMPMIVASARAFGPLLIAESQPETHSPEGLLGLGRHCGLHQERHKCPTADWALQCALPPGPCSLLAETYYPAHFPPPPLLRPLLREGGISLFPGPGQPGSFGNGLLCQHLLSTLNFLPVFGYWLLPSKLFLIMKHNFRSMSIPLDVCFSPAIGFSKHLKQAEKCLKML